MISSENIKPIIKASAIVVNEEGALLIVKKKSSDIWISLGGKQEPGEELIDTLIREVGEELQVTIVGTPVLFHTSPVEPASDKPNLFVQIFSFLTVIDGKPTVNPNDNIEAFHWLTRTEFENGKYRLGSVLQKFVVPKLVNEGYLK